MVAIYTPRSTTPWIEFGKPIPVIYIAYFQMSLVLNYLTYLHIVSMWQEVESNVNANLTLIGGK